MPIEFICQSCSKKLRVPDDSGGKKSRCPDCGAIMQVPQPSYDQQEPPEQPDEYGSLPSPPPHQSDKPAPDFSSSSDLSAQAAASGNISSGSEDPSNPFAEQAVNPYSSPMETGGSGLPPHRGGTIFTMGLMALICSVPNCLCCYLMFMMIPALCLAIPAWVMGRADLLAMRQGGMDPSGEGQTRGGIVMAIIALAICALAIITWIALLVVGIVSSEFN